MDELEQFIAEEIWPYLPKSPEHQGRAALSSNWGTKTPAGLKRVIQRLAEASREANGE